MVFVTFQPEEVLDTINSKGVYNAPENLKLNNKIFCLRVDESIMLRIFMCAPSMPQTAIVFSTDEYEELDSVAWVNKVFLNEDTPTTSKYKEYTVDKIKKEDIMYTIDISDSDDPDEVQDDFMDHMFVKFQRVSGYRWKRLADVADDIVGTPIAEELCELARLCLMPYRKVTEEDYVKWEELIIKIFRKEKR